jgi:hypothetical protein
VISVLPPPPVHKLLDQPSKGLYCQLILMPLLQGHRILAQVAGHELPVIKLLPPLVLSEADVDWIERGFAEVIGDSRSLGRMFDLGRTLATQVMRERAGVASAQAVRSPRRSGRRPKRSAAHQ